MKCDCNRLIQIVCKLAIIKLMKLKSHAGVKETRSNGFVLRPGRRSVQNYVGQSETLLTMTSQVKVYI